MTDNEQLKALVEAELQWEPRAQGAAIGVAVERVRGVLSISDDLTVKLPFAHERSDTEIEYSAQSAMHWDVEVPDEAIALRVVNGVVTIQGTVEWQYQRKAAEQCVRRLTGNVHTWPERAAAERAAWCAPGVTDVQDLISVGA